MEAVITAIGNAVPKYREAQSRMYDLMDRCLRLSKAEKRVLKTIYNEAGIEYRYSVLEDFTKKDGLMTFFPNDSTEAFPSTRRRMKVYKDNALALALAAVEDCFSQVSGFDKSGITHVVTVSCTGMSAPGLDIELVQHLNLRYSTKRTTINFMGCYGAFNGLKFAHSICRADKDAKVLLVSVEMCTIHFQQEPSLDNLISSAIFSDGAGAVLVEGTPSLGRYLVLRDFYCDIVPESGSEMTWDVGDQGFDIRLSSYVPRLIEKGICEFAGRLLKRQALVFENIQHFAIHPGAKRILEVCEQALNIKPESNRFSYEVLRDYGNMSSATILFVLKRLWQSLGKADDNKNIFCCAFGPGLTLESMILNSWDG